MAINKRYISRPPSIHTTEHGYQYVRCRIGGDNTCYIHQLTIIADGADPHDVFSDQYDVHHLISPPHNFDAPKLDFPENLVLVPRWEHRNAELHGGYADDVEQPFPTPQPPTHDDLLEADDD